MKILCKSATQVPGHGIVTKGETVEWPDGLPFPPQVLGNFVKAGTGDALCNKEPQPPKKDTGDKPNDADDKPKDAGDKPNDADDKPKDAGDKPKDADDKPKDTGGERPPTPEEVAAEQARAEQLAKDELVKRTAALGKEKLTAALDACGAAYKAKDSCETLAKTLLRAQGQDID